MAEGTSERNGPISNIMNSLWSNSSSNDDAFFDSLKLVSEIAKPQKIISVVNCADKKAEDNRIFHFFNTWCILFRTGEEYNNFSVIAVVLYRHCCCFHFSF